MKQSLLPAIGIIVVAAILLAVNEFTEATFIRDYALLFIIGGMFLGMWLTKWAERSKNKE